MEDAIQRAAKARYGRRTTSRQARPRHRRSSPVARRGSGRGGRGSLQAGRPEAGREAADGASVGDYIVDPLPPIEFGRIAAQASKQVIFQKVRDAERERQFEEFKDRAGEIITGVVKRVEFGHVVVDLGRARASSAATSRSRAKSSASATARVR
jgi:N utilization substance protein A